MKSGSREGKLIVEFMMYIVVSVLFMSTGFRLYTGVLEDYRKNLSFLRHTDYAYHAFEVLKVDLYTHTQSVALSGNELHIRKEDYIPGREVVLLLKGKKLIYRYGKTEQDVCHDLTDVKMRRRGDVLFIGLEFSDVSYERGFYIGP